MRIDRIGPGEVERVLTAGDLFDQSPRRQWTEGFLGRSGHHLLIASVDRVDVGFTTGIEIAHPDKGVEMLLYELGVTASYRRRGTGKALVDALARLAQERGCRAMWVPLEPDDEPALATYLAAGGSRPEPSSIIEWTFE